MHVLDAVERVLREANGPLHYTEITQRILKQSLWTTSGKTPQETVNARLAVEIVKHGERSRFIRTARGTFALRGPGTAAAPATKPSPAPKRRGATAPKRGRSAQPPPVQPPAVDAVAHKSWREAIMTVLRDSAEPLHYAQIAERIAERKLRADLGATPAATVASMVSVSISNEGEKSPFVRVGRGIYSLRGQVLPSSSPAPKPAETEEAETGLIHAFGMFWRRDRVLWSSPRLFGKQQADAKVVNFAEQNGVYLLHDGRSIVYVGRIIDRGLARRLKEHTTDRLEGRWDRFSWFGVRPVEDTGKLSDVPGRTLDLETLIVTMEALLIEAVEPPQNRKRGDDFRAVEFMQVEDPEIKRTRTAAMLDELKTRL